MDAGGAGGLLNNDTGAIVSKDLSWSAALDKVWYAMPAFTAQDVGSTVRFSDETWELMRLLNRSEMESDQMGDEREETTRLGWDKKFGCEAKLTIVTFYKGSSAPVERLVSWQGEWSFDGIGGTFAKILDSTRSRAVTAAVQKAPVQKALERAPDSGEFKVISVEVDESGKDRVMQKVTLGKGNTPVMELYNPELYPSTKALLAMRPTIVTKLASRLHLGMSSTTSDRGAEPLTDPGRSPSATQMETALFTA